MPKAHRVCKTEFCVHTLRVCSHPGFGWLLVEDGEGSWLLRRGTAAGFSTPLLLAKELLGRLLLGIACACS